MLDEEGRMPAEQAALARVLGGPPRRRRRTEGGRPAGRDPMLAGELVEEMVSREGWELDVSLGSIAAGWEGIVGTQVAEHCAPEAFSEGELTVRADSSAWAAQLRLLEGQLVGALAQAVGEGVVTGVKVVGPSAARRRGRYIARR